ncbi:MAG: hypothetical protein RLZZ546_2012 [Bacteroidota bacterium]
MIRYIILGFCCLLSMFVKAQNLKIAENKRFFTTQKGKPFFWQGDTGWLLFIKLTREEAIQYLDDRAAKGFNVIQAILIHDLNLGTNMYGDSAVQNKDVSKPIITKKSNFKNKAAYDYWDHVDYIISAAAKRNIFIALVPMWGSNVKYVSVYQGKAYASFLANRFKKHNNIVWMNGGDTKGGDALELWNTIGNTLNELDTKHLITFHPRGRTSSSDWFHNESWLDFNIYQSGHRAYYQDTIASEKRHYGEDTWKYMNDDYSLLPTKPSFDAEPSYENIPYGLHKKDQPYWQDFEIRRYAYWSVFAGGCGFTYGQNAVMQFHNIGDKDSSFFPYQNWQEGIKAIGSTQMQYLKNLVLNYDYLSSMPAQEYVLNNGEKYNRIAVLKSNTATFFYTYNGSVININKALIKGVHYNAKWYNPKNGMYTTILTHSEISNSFDPPGDVQNGNDWVLIIEKLNCK